MIEWAKLTMTEINKIDRELPVIIPIGLIESHGPHMGVNVDTEGAEHVARKVCEETGAILMPSIAYGYIGKMRDYSGTVGVCSETLSAMVADILDCLARQGFMKVIFLSGHVANRRGVELGFEKAWNKHPRLKLAYWIYWIFAGVPMRHADKIETEFAMLMGTPVNMKLAKDYVFKEPWHAVFSRHYYYLESGVVQGEPSKAKVQDSQIAYQKVLATLITKVNEAIDDKTK